MEPGVTSTGPPSTTIQWKTIMADALTARILMFPSAPNTAPPQSGRDERIAELVMQRARANGIDCTREEALAAWNGARARDR